MQGAGVVEETESQEGLKLGNCISTQMCQGQRN